MFYYVDYDYGNEDDNDKRNADNVVSDIFIQTAIVTSMLVRNMEMVLMLVPVLMRRAITTIAKLGNNIAMMMMMMIDGEGNIRISA